MVTKNVILGTFFLVSTLVCSQVDKTCKDKEKDVLDLNSISKSKCSTEDSKKINLITSRRNRRIQVSTRRRVVRRKNVSSASSIAGSNKLEAIKKSTELVSKLKIDNTKIADKLPFNFVEQKPIFSSCESLDGQSQTKCFKEKLSEHVRKNFKYPESSYNKGIQGRVLVQFVIDELGNIDEIVTRGPYLGEELEKEAERIVKAIPKMSSPGKMNGTPVKVKYGIPLTFKIPGVKPTNIKKKETEDVKLEDVVNFSMVENIPLFDKCENKSTEDEKLTCFNSQLGKHVKKYFVYPEEALKKKIQGRVYAYFVIDSEGDVVNIKTRGPKNGELLEEATKRIVKKFSKFIPGTDENGEPKNVKYAFPINFKLN